MKKVFIINLLIFIILTMCLNISYASVPITEEALQSALESLKQSESFNQDAEIYMDKTNKKIKMSTKDNKNNILNYNINYDLSAEPTFTTEITIDTTTTYEEWSKKQAELISPIILYIPIASINGVSEDDSLLYSNLKIISEFEKSTSSSLYIISETYDNVTIIGTNGNKIPVSEFSKYAVDITKDYYKSDIIVNDSDSANTFKLVSKIKESSEDSCTVQTVFTINSNGDFSKISESNDNTKNELTNSIISAANNAINRYNNDVIQEQEAINKLQTQIFTNIIVNTANKLPQTGDFFDLKDGLILLCITASIFLIAIVTKGIKYKNIDKK